MALYCLATPTSGAGTAERGHKETNFIKSKVQNRLGSEKTDDLIYIRWNASQSKKVEAVNYPGAAPRWCAEDASDDDTDQIQETEQEIEADIDAMDEVLGGGGGGAEMGENSDDKLAEEEEASEFDAWGEAVELAESEYSMGCIRARTEKRKSRMDNMRRAGAKDKRIKPTTQKNADGVTAVCPPSPLAAGQTITSSGRAIRAPRVFDVQAYTFL